MGANQQTSVPAFVQNQVLTAQQVTEINTGVPVFADTTARDAAFGGTGEKTLAEGQLAYIENLDVVQWYNGSSWATLGPFTVGVVQVKSTTKTDTFTMSSSTFADITSLSVSITPTSASNKIFISCMVNFQGNDGSTTAQLRLMRDSTAIGLGDTAGNRTPATAGMISLNNVQLVPGHISFLDSPGVATATTYKVQIRADVNGQTVFVNRTPLDTDSANFVRTISTITVFEVTP